MTDYRKKAAELQKTYAPIAGWSRLGSLHDSENFAMWYRPIDRKIVVLADGVEHSETMRSPDEFMAQLLLLHKFYGGLQKHLFG